MALMESATITGRRGGEGRGGEGERERERGEGREAPKHQSTKACAVRIH